MNSLKTTLGALCIGVFASSAVAQDVFACSQTDLILTRANDKNSNGTTNEPGEYTKCAYGLNVLRTGTDIKATTVFGPPALLWLDNNNSVKGVLKLVDSNGDGIFQDTEISPVMTSLHTAFGSTASNTFLGGLTQDAAGDLYVANNQFALATPASNGILKIQNITGVPTASTMIKTGDVVPVYDDFVTPNGAAVTTNGGSYERITMLKSSGWIYTYHTKDDVVYALKDIDGDGKFITPGEIVNFLNVSGHKTGLVRNPDFSAGGVYAARGNDFNLVTPSATNGNYLVFNYTEVDQTTGTVWLGTRTQPLGLGGTDISGIILRCQDLNNNGTCNDAGEVTIWVDSFNMSTGTFDLNGTQYKPSASSTPGWTGLAVDDATGIVYAGSNEGPLDLSGTFKADIVWKFVDSNNDGDAMDPGEQIAYNVQRPAGSVMNEIEVTSIGFNPNFPTCSNFEVPGAQNPLNVTGLCTSGATPSLRPGIRFYKNAPYLGNPDFQVSVTGIQIGVDYGQLYVSEAPWDPVLVSALWAILCPGDPIFCVSPSNPANLDEWLPLGVWNSPSPMYVDILDLYGTGTFWADVTGLSVGDGIMGKCLNGTVSNTYIGRFDISFAVPNDPLLAGKAFRMQWHVGDPLSLPLVGTGFAIPRAVSDLGIVVLN